VLLRVQPHQAKPLIIIATAPMITPHTPGFIYCGTCMRYSLSAAGVGIVSPRPPASPESSIHARCPRGRGMKQRHFVHRSFTRFHTCRRKYHQKLASSVAFARKMLKSCANYAEATDARHSVPRVVSL
jgi:hypothetical protein